MRWQTGLLLLLLLTLTSAPPLRSTEGDPEGPSEAPLTNEDVVRMVAQARPEVEMLRIIAASKVDFDLDPDVVVEMRRAGVPEKILRAMRQRQTEAGGRSAPPPVPPLRAAGSVELIFLPMEEGVGARGKPSFSLIRRTPRWASRQLAMPEKAEVEELAIFLLCSSAEHVPDHWSGRTPLKNFVRHELLVFRAGSHPGKLKGFEVLFLDLPASLHIPVPEGIHSLVVGVAGKTGPDWHVAASDDQRGVEVSTGKTTRIEVRLSGRIEGTFQTGFKPEQGLAIGRVTPPEEAP